MAGIIVFVALLAASLNEVSAKGTMQLLTRQQVMARTTMESATKVVLSMNLTHAHSHELVALIKDKFGAKRRKSALRAGGAKVLALADTDAATSKTATEMINEMMEETDFKLGIEQETCRAFNRTRLALLQSTRNSVSTFNAAANRARGQVLAASSEIRRLTQEVSETQSAMDAHKRQCEEEIQALKDELQVVMADLDVMEKVLELTDCATGTSTGSATALAQVAANASSASLVNCAHCNKGRGFMTLQSSKVQPLLSKLKSAAAHTYMQQQLKAAFHRASRKRRPVALAQVDIAEMRRLTRGMVRHRTSRRGQARHSTRNESDGNVSISAVPEEPVPADCTFTDKCVLTAENCQTLQDRFLLIQAGIMDKKVELTKELGQTEDECEKQTAIYKEQLENLDTRLAGEQSKLATATGEQNDAEAGSNLKASEFVTLQSEYHEKMTSCCDNQNELLSEQCALAKIRGELANLSDESSYIIDCEVSDWDYEACDKSCDGGTRKMTRSVLVHPKGGKACPALTQFESCNEDACPIDCVANDWQEWSGCSAQCDGGTMTRTRTVKREAEHGGEECGPLADTSPCNVQACNKDCDLADWTEWTDCSKYCDIGHARRIRAVESPPVGTGTCPIPESDERLQFQECNVMTCQSLLPTPDSLLTCKSKADIIVLLDGSGSLGSYGWKKSQAFAKYFIQSLKGGEENVKVALQVFSGPKTWTDYYYCIGWWPNAQVDMEEQCSIKWVQHFTSDTANLAELVEEQEWPAASTLTSVALGEAEAEFIHGRADANWLVVVITDGFPISTTRTREAAEKLKQKANVLWVPVGNSAPIDMIKEMASLPKDEHVVHINNFAQMASTDIINKVLANACPDIEIPPIVP